MPSTAENFAAGLGAFNFGSAFAQARQANRDRALRAKALEMEGDLAQSRLTLDRQQEGRLQAGLDLDKRRLDLAEAAARQGQELHDAEMRRARFGLKYDKWKAGREAALAPIEDQTNIGLLGARIKDYEAQARASEARAKIEEDKLARRNEYLAQDRDYASQSLDELFITKEQEYGTAIPTVYRKEALDALTKWLAANPEADDDAIGNVLMSLEGKLDSWLRRNAAPATPAVLGAPPSLAPATAVPPSAQFEAQYGDFLRSLLRGEQYQPGRLTLEEAERRYPLGPRSP